MSSGGDGKGSGNPLKDYDVNIDYYAALGIESDADAGAIRRAYYKKSLELHPDKNQDNPDAAAHFNNAKVAYELLSNEAARQAYDAVLARRYAEKARKEQLNAAKRKMLEDLEERERAVEDAKKRKAQAQAASANRASEIERQRFENSQKIRELEADLVRRARAAQTQAASSTGQGGRTVKFKWCARQKTLDDEELRALLEQRAGSAREAAIVHVLVASVCEGKEQGSAVVQFASPEAAAAVVTAFSKGSELALKLFDDIAIVDGGDASARNSNKPGDLGKRKPVPPSQPPPTFAAAKASSILDMEADILGMMQRGKPNSQEARN